MSKDFQSKQFISPLTQGHIVLFADRFSPFVGGVETHADAFIEYFTKNKAWELRQVLTFSSDAFPAAENIKGRQEGSLRILTVPVHHLSQDSMFNPREVFSSIDALNLEHKSILFFNSLYWIRIFPQLRERYPEMRLILRSGGNDVIQAQIDGQGASLAERQKFVVDTINNTVSCLIVNSNYSFERSVGLGIDSKKMVVVRGGVDIAKFHKGTPLDHCWLRRKLSLPQSIPIILVVCRLMAFKGVEDVVGALKLVPVSTPFHCVVVGDGPQRDLLAAHITREGLADRITLCPAVSHAEVSHYFLGSDIYCLAPIYYQQKVAGGTYIHTETMGRSFCEAAAAGLPAVGTNVGGVPEIVRDGITGFLSPERSPNLIAENLSTLLLNDSLRETMGAHARSLSKQEYSWGAVFKTYQHIFQK